MCVSLAPAVWMGSALWLSSLCSVTYTHSCFAPLAIICCPLLYLEWVGTQTPTRPQRAPPCQIPAWPPGPMLQHGMFVPGARYLFTLGRQKVFSENSPPPLLGNILGEPTQFSPIEKRSSTTVYFLYCNVSPPWKGSNNSKGIHFSFLTACRSSFLTYFPNVTERQTLKSRTEKYDNI